MPTVFISSTSEDLKGHREAARDAAIAEGFLPVMMEYWHPSGRPSLAECLRRVAESDLLIVLVAHRCGWKPADGNGNSVTRLECDEAERLGKTVVPFLAEDAYPWPSGKDTDRFGAAFGKVPPDSKEISDITDDVTRLAQFKTWLKQRHSGFFTTPDSLKSEVAGALRKWKDEHHVATAPQAPDPGSYLQELQDRCATISVRGLTVGKGEAHNFPIDDLYIPLTISATSGKRSKRGPELAPEMAGQPPQPVLLEEALEHPRLVIIGDPGSGKSTFLRHIAHARCRDLAAAKPDTPFPILLSISELVPYLAGKRPTAATLAEFLAQRASEANQHLPANFFQKKLSEGPAILLLDGLDEAPDATSRAAIVQLFEKATRSFRNCRFVVTTRPASYEGESLLGNFQTATIEPLGSDAIEAFLARWCDALFPGKPAEAAAHLADLAPAIRVPEIHRMATNPVMLTALAVVHWNEKQLPEQRAELYKSITGWLAKSRQHRPGRLSPEACLQRLQVLALAMQQGPSGRMVDAERGWAARILAPHFPGATAAEQEQAALKFLDEEEGDSGIVIRRGFNVKFWHLTFQEFLAAKAIAAKLDSEYIDLLVEQGNVYKPEWREVVLLFCGILCRELGPSRVDFLVQALLTQLGDTQDLKAQAVCYGLLGCIVNDLRPDKYRPADHRFPKLESAVLAIFDRKRCASVPFALRLEVAEALGQAGDPRIGRKENWILLEGNGKVKPFWIAKYMVTVQEFRRFVDDEGYKDKRWWNAGGYGESRPLRWTEQMEHPNRPVYGVSWYAAKAYCAREKVRLLTDAEWDLAAKGKTDRPYPWGTQDPNPRFANYRHGSSPGHPTPVGLYPEGETPEGVADLAGNLREWVEDVETNVVGEELWVPRGGSCDGNAENLRCGARWVYRPGDFNFYFGLRVAREA